MSKFYLIRNFECMSMSAAVKDKPFFFARIICDMKRVSKVLLKLIWFKTCSGKAVHVAMTTI